MCVYVRVCVCVCVCVCVRERERDRERDPKPWGGLGPSWVVVQQKKKNISTHCLPN